MDLAFLYGIEGITISDNFLAQERRFGGCLASSCQRWSEASCWAGAVSVDVCEEAKAGSYANLSLTRGGCAHSRHGGPSRQKDVLMQCPERGMGDQARVYRGNPCL